MTRPVSRVVVVKIPSQGDLCQSLSSTLLTKLEPHDPPRTKGGGILEIALQLVALCNELSCRWRSRPQHQKQTFAK